MPRIIGKELNIHTTTPLTLRQERRRAIRGAHLNGILWSVGNGLVSTTLVVYLALELGAKGFDISLILAAPHVAGLLRLAAPPLMAGPIRRKTLCLVGFLLSSLVLLGLPWCSAPGRLATAGQSLSLLIGLWCLFHLLQYAATVALWSWMADAAPARVRGRFLGHRERWMLVGSTASMLASGAFTYGWKLIYPNYKWLGYAIAASLGAVLMLLALLPLYRMPALDSNRRIHAQRSAWWWLEPLVEPRLFWLLAFACWSPFVNGLTQSPQNVYPAKVLEFSLWSMLAMQAAMRVGQFGISPTVGRWIDLWGNRPVLWGSQAIVSLAMLFYAVATPEQPWWIVAAWLLWVAYAGLNVGLPNLLLKQARPGTNAAAVAVYFAVNSLSYALGTLLGGWLFDHFRDGVWHTANLGTWNFFQLNFAAGCVLRLLGLFFLFQIVEGRPPEPQEEVSSEGVE